MPLGEPALAKNKADGGASDPPGAADCEPGCEGARAEAEEEEEEGTAVAGAAAPGARALTDAGWGRRGGTATAGTGSDTCRATE